MASLRVLAFDHEGRAIQFDVWLDDLQLYLLSNSRDSVSLFDHTSCAAPAPPAMAMEVVVVVGVVAGVGALVAVVVAAVGVAVVAAMGVVAKAKLTVDLKDTTQSEHKQAATRLVYIQSYNSKEVH
ncbi:unnamed protein product [Closterium sp. NIES-54]